MEQLSVTTDDSDKTSPSLSDMPVDVVSLIIERSKYKEQLKLRKVSKSLRALVDKQKPTCKSIKFDFFYGNIGIKFDNHWVVVYTDEEYVREGDEIIVKKGNFMKVAFNELASTLKNPKLQLEEFVIVDNVANDIVSEIYSNKIRNVLKSLSHKLSVKNFASDLPFPSNLLSVLPYLKSGFLKKITLMLFDEVDLNIYSTKMDRLALLDQWKQAESIELLFCFDRFPMKYATHFQGFLIMEFDIDDDKFTRIRNYLSKLDHFEQCTLSCKQFAQRIAGHQLLGAPVFSNKTEEVFHHPIPDSDYFFEFKKSMNSDDVKIVKKKRNGNR